MISVGISRLCQKNWHFMFLAMLGFLPQKFPNYHFSKLCSFGLQNALLYFKEIHTKNIPCLFYVNSV